ncbi:MAG TPA: hypothetical protein VKM55_09975 [Candidatus Lokiarchaeia archaeon]|nr:hypothetical protein [Candidatus Lokiarchaeia archaeon]
MEFIFSHLWIMPFASLLQILVLLGYIWFPKARDPGNEYVSKCIKILRGIPLGIFYVFGLIFINAFFDIVVIGAYGYATWAQTFPDAIIGLACGINLVLMGFLVAPDVKSLISGGLYAIAFFVYIKIFIPITENVWNVLWVLVIIIVAFAIHGMMLVTEFILKHAIKDFRGDRQIWNFRPWFKKKFNIYVQLILYILAMTECLLQFTGYSILTIFF